MNSINWIAVQLADLPFVTSGKVVSGLVWNYENQLQCCVAGIDPQQSWVLWILCLIKIKPPRHQPCCLTVVIQIWKCCLIAHGVMATLWRLFLCKITQVIINDSTTSGYRYIKHNCTDVDQHLAIMDYFSPVTLQPQISIKLVDKYATDLARLILTSLVFDKEILYEDNTFRLPESHCLSAVCSWM